ncbi:MAG: diadenylate cyclase CdaA [Oscillospiraceae bacterium]|nr:diadenylate cyclase CdaA [Oscillospiraceae bacterium]
MSTLTVFLSNAINYIKLISISDILDIAIVAFLIYKLIGFVRKTNLVPVAKGLVVLLVALWLSGELHFTMINWLLRNIVELGLIALVIIFHPELRRFLEKVGSSRITGIFGGEYKSMNMESAIMQTVLACADLSRSRTGALIIFERDNQLAEPISTGTLLNADVTAELMKNIFFVKAPLHDGAVIIKNGRIAAAGCMLPMSANMNLSRDLGMRHRAGIGVSERSDAVAVIVSEETGAISVAVDGMLKRHLTTETVETLLRKELVPAVEGNGKKSLMDKFRGKKNG